jgi:hypothetical protein
LHLPGDVARRPVEEEILRHAPRADAALAAADRQVRRPPVRKVAAQVLTMPLTIEPLMLEGGDAGDAELVAYFVNTGEETIDLAGAWGASRMLIDGVPYTRAMTMWCGTSSLGPGRSWGVVVDLDAYWSPDRLPIKAGAHDVQF